MPTITHRRSAIASMVVLGLLAAPVTAAAFEVKTTVADTPLSLKVDGFASAYYSFVFENPDSGISNARIFASRHNSITISGASIGFELRYGAAFVYVAPWFGLTPTTIYSGEPTFPPGPDGLVGGSDSTVWRYLRGAHGGFELDNLTFDAGLFVSPIGIEGIAEKDNWLWSSSWLNYIFPFYHFGARVHYDLGDDHTLGLWVVNGFAGGALDTNDAKSIIVTAAGPIGDGQWQVLYYGGIERPDDLRNDLDLDVAWLHHFDVWVSLPINEWLEVAMQADLGLEPNQYGVAWYAAGAAYVRVRLSDYVSVAARGDVFGEQAAEDDNGASSPLFFGLPDWVAAASIAVEVRPVEHTAIRLEYRHDEAQGGLFYDHDDSLPTAKSQDAVTLGLTVWM